VKNITGRDDVTHESLMAMQGDIKEFVEYESIV
jgi:hypothetical protein